ncbi:amidohydrolase family protein [Histidinibacterium lentulum]|uniref:Alkylphosphonate utilization protein n=1 Tax=Histidinibacterium lentulum TaxID=2480588 RepID=A0A3N2QYM0_9RHOB|nr:amidohydrolase family protein [Histidinibacterium lentulum]ROU00314.1 alkylphosphonate utilization protein [Histidinibacterium lentulum]
MPGPLPPLRLTGATVLRDGGLQDRTVAIAGGRISAGPYPAVDLSGFFILPGMVDLSVRALDRDGPPPTETSARAALAEAGRAAAMAGVTTGWATHLWSASGAGAAERAEACLRALDRHRAETLVDLRIALTYDAATLPATERLLAAIRRHGVDRLAFVDAVVATKRTPAFDPARLRAMAEARGLSAEALSQELAGAPVGPRELPRILCRIAEALDILGVSYGSQGDADGETREFFAMLGARICESPAALRAASLARAVGDPVVAAVSGSEAAQVPATALVRAGKCSALASGGRPAALARTAFALADDGVLDLPRAWRLVSEAPAALMRLPDRGVIAQGKRADLAIVNKATRQVEATLVAGRLVFAAGEAAMRFVDARQAAVPVAAE